MNHPYNTMASIGDAGETDRFFMLIDSIGAGQHAPARYYWVAKPRPQRARTHENAQPRGAWHRECRVCGWRAGGM